MATIRVLAEHDIPAVADLFIRSSPRHYWSGHAACAEYFLQMLFGNPWRDPEIPSWVAEHSGRIVGYYAIMPRPMQLNGRALRVAVGCQFVVDPDHRNSLIALKLAQECLSGPQDLTLADGANDTARRMWLAMGGAAPLLYNLQWIRLLRPARYMLSLLEDHAGVPRAVTFAARPACLLADAVASRLRWNRVCRRPTGLVERDLDPATMMSNLSMVMHGSELRPSYDLRSLSLLLQEASRKTSLGTLRGRTVIHKGQAIGWYLYYRRPGAVSEVLQIAAHERAFDNVLRCLLSDAWSSGSAALKGRLDPRYVNELSARHCWLRREGASVLVHSRQPDVLDAIRRGSAVLSRLEGEWWLRFPGA